jgi:hypothetical protein
MNLQHVNVKLLVKDPAAVDLELLIPVFHRWIQEKVFEERLLDIADYRHVPEGPGVILIGHEGDYSVDNTDGRLGVRYNRKAALEGDTRERLRQATLAALQACRRLESDASLGGTLQFNGQDVEIFFNDRLLAPNNDATRAAAEPGLRAFLDELFHGSEYSLSFDSDPRRLFGAAAKAARAFDTAELLRNLGAA